MKTGQAMTMDTGLNTSFSTQTDYVSYVLNNKDGKDAQSHLQTKLVFVDHKMQKIKEVIGQLKDTKVPVLITGEVGVGKSTIANLIHELSPQSQLAIKFVECVNPNDFNNFFSQMEGQTFSGTLVLESVSELSAFQQEIVLKFIQKQNEKNSDQSVRIISTTTRDIMDSVIQGRFRQDLFYCLNVIQLDIPPLRERKEDTLALVQFFMHNYAKDAMKMRVSLKEEAKEKLLHYSWQENIKELKAFIKKLVLTSATEEISADQVDLPEESSRVEDEWIKALPLGRALRDVETQFILQTLRFHSGNRTHAAKTLGISLRTLRNKINEFTAEGFEVMKPALGKANV